MAKRDALAAERQHHLLGIALIKKGGRVAVDPNGRLLFLIALNHRLSRRLVLGGDWRRADIAEALLPAREHTAFGIDDPNAQLTGRQQQCRSRRLGPPENLIRWHR